MPRLPSKWQAKCLSAILGCCVLTTFFSPLISSDSQAATEALFKASPVLSRLRKISLANAESRELDILFGEEVGRRLQTTGSPYTLDDVLAMIPYFKTEVFVLVYYAATDEFILLYDERLKWNNHCNWMIGAFPLIASTVRHLFPDKFLGPESSDLVALISEGDMGENLIEECRVRPFCNAKEFTPILHFGNMMVSSPARFPTVQPMPKFWTGLMNCFYHYASTGGLCPDMYANDWAAALEDIGFNKTWDNLIPQVVWRGADWTDNYGAVEKPNWKRDIEPKLKDVENKKQAAVDALNSIGIRPRWKGAVLTAEAEMEAEAAGEDVLPWANIKITSFDHNGVQVPSYQGQEYAYWASLGIPTAERDEMEPIEMAKYKYHLTIGGDSWAEALQKMAMPGLLFRVENDPGKPSDDYVKRFFRPNVHYVPVKPDLSDLKQKFDWAEANPVAAQRISNKAITTVKKFANDNKLNELVWKNFGEGWANVIEAYQPEPGVLEELLLDEASYLFPLIKCRAQDKDDCVHLADERTNPEGEEFFSLPKNII